jgi:hypothetical protein
MFMVSFLGNAYTENQKAVDLCLLRCAELCLNNDFNYYTIIGNTENRENSSYTTPVDLEQKVYVVGNVGRNNTFTVGDDTYTYSKPSVHNTILCFKDKPEETCYNAKILMKSVKEKYKIE